MAGLSADGAQLTAFGLSRSQRCLLRLVVGSPSGFEGWNEPTVLSLLLGQVQTRVSRHFHGFSTWIGTSAMMPDMS